MGDMTARDILRALWLHYTPRYAVLTEFSTYDAGTYDRSRGIAQHRRIDALLVSKTERIGVEVKVTRADFLADVRRPEKQEPWRALTHRFAYAVPAGMTRPGEVPTGTGLIEVTPALTDNPWDRPQVVWKIRAKPRHPGGHLPLPDHVMWAATIRLAQAEARLKGYHGTDHNSDDVDDLKTRIRDLERSLSDARDVAARAAVRADRWQRIAAANGPVPCRWCGQPIRSLGTGYRSRWEHRSMAHVEMCESFRNAAAPPDRTWDVPSIEPAVDDADA